jgi:hypothetical protein
MTYRLHSLEQLTIIGTLVLAASLGFACGGGKSTPIVSPTSSATKVNTSTKTDSGLQGQTEENSGTSASGACESVDNCPEANMDVASPGFTSTGLKGFVGEAVPWEFAGLDLNSRDRRVAVLLNNIPANSKLTPSDRADVTARIEWTPGQRLKSGKQLEIYTRDLDRCEINEADPEVCRSYKFLDAYDKKTAIDWEIVAKDDLEDEANASPTSTGTPTDSGDTSAVVNVSKPPCTPQPSTATGGLGGLSSVLGSGGLGGFGGFGGGGLLSSITGGGGGLGGLPIGGLGGGLPIGGLGGGLPTGGATASTPCP